MLNFGWLLSSIAEVLENMHRNLFPFCENIVRYSNNRAGRNFYYRLTVLLPEKQSQGATF